MRISPALKKVRDFVLLGLIVSRLCPRASYCKNNGYLGHDCEDGDLRLI